MFALKWTDRKDRQESVSVMDGKQDIRCYYWILEMEKVDGLERRLRG